MRNLQHIWDERHVVEHASSSCFRGQSVITARLTNGLITIEQLGSKRRVLATFDAPDITPTQTDRIVDLHYSEEDDTLCIIMFGGDIILVRLEESDGGEPVEIIGTIDQHVLAAQWSPEDDVIALATEHTLSLLTKTFESLAEIAITDSDIKASATQVSVGWGRAETQFRGKHAPRDPTLPEFIDEGKLSEADARLVTISWRGDAAFLSLSTISSGRRVIRVYSRDGSLESTSEAVDYQESPLSWRPSGNLLASVQHKATNQCIFFEKNGLRHGEFDLRTTNTVQKLLWNADSTVLSAQYDDHIDLWVSSNYHYSLKASVQIPNASQSLWHPEHPLKLLITSPGEVRQIEFAWTLTSHTPTAPNDFGLLAMIDGKQLNLTPVRLANVPPPMSFRSLDLGELPISVAISDDTRVIAVLFRRTLVILDWNLTLKPIRTPIERCRIPLSFGKDSIAQQVVINNKKHIGILASSGDFLTVIDDQITQHYSSGPLTKTLHSYDTDFMVQDYNGNFAFVENNDTIAAIPEFCSTVATGIVEESRMIFGLSQSGKLYANSRVVASKVTSFLLLPFILAYTTANYLKFVRLDSAMEDVSDSIDDERCRQIERGSVLICASPSSQSMTLQAPRGNLETIYPRLLVLEGIRQLIDTSNWKEAWTKAKIHRIDVNIMCDHDPSLFLSSLKNFIAQLGSSTELDLFLTGLKAEDVSQTMFQNTSLDKLGLSSHSPTLTNKINDICDRILERLHEDFSSTHLTSILTAHLSKSPAAYEAALDVISSLPKAEIEDAVTHVCFLADAHLLYNQALGLYDLPLALLLAQRSQKDPREYVPFLQKIQKMSTHRQRFSLDDHLGRHEKALQHLLAMEDAWSETLEYIQRHTLWTHAIELLRYDREQYLRLVKPYAEYLFARQEFAEAGHAFEIVKDYSKATEAYESAAMWSEALHVATRGSVDHIELASRMAELMIDRSKFLDAAEIHKDYLHDTDGAITLYCRAFKFAKAILLAKDEDKINTLVKPGLTEAFVQLSELFAEMKTQLNNQLPRLREVRLKRDDNPEGYFEGMIEEDTPDNVSLAGTQASTTASVYTRYTGTTAMSTQSKRSAKGRRRQERQRAKGKKGTIWEEEYLVNSIKRLVERLEQTRGDALHLVMALVRCDMREQAHEIQASIMHLISISKSNLDEVFSGILTLPEELQRSMGTKPDLKEFEVFNLC